MVVGEPEQALVHHRPHLAHQLAGLLQRHGRHPRVVGPSQVVHVVEIVGHAFGLALLGVREAVSRVLGGQRRGPFRKAGVQRVGHHPGTGELLEVHLKPVILEQPPVVRRVPEHAVGGFQVEAVHEQPPEPVALAEVDGPVHGLHAARRQPGPTRVEKRVGRRLVVDALKEAQPASGQVGIGHGRGVAVEKSR